LIIFLLWSTDQNCLLEVIEIIMKNLIIKINLSVALEIIVPQNLLS